MPELETMDRNQKAVLWLKTGVDSYSQPLVAETPIELDVRWNHRGSVMTGPTGEPVAVNAVVIVDRDIPLGSSMWLGTLADLSGTGSTPEEDVMEVVAQSKTYSLCGKYIRRTVGLVRASDTLPEKDDDG